MDCIRRGSFDRSPAIPSYQLSKIKFDHTDIRFTTKGETLYVIALGWPPDGKFLIKSLAEGSPQYPRKIHRVELLGAKSEVKWKRDAQGLEIIIAGLSGEPVNAAMKADEAASSAVTSTAPKKHKVKAGWLALGIAGGASLGLGACIYSLNTRNTSGKMILGSMFAVPGAAATGFGFYFAFK